ncbi:hypothetical protein P9160_07430 [Bacillus halotolerans]|uniref:DUF4064 domain-containing protein n=1 Tax=Bacillus TaxID=1386 RepID=UPI000BAE3E0E|nr:MULTISPECIES: DUF4064 domain-containing protein [Bacillus]MEC3757213.1 hypothetical protein [Bacillus halotolerans]PAY13746.1 hypothetical protein CJU60_07450 [Bacillus sp. 7705b]
MKRIVEFVLSLIGSILGIVAAIIALIIAYSDALLNAFIHLDLQSELIGVSWGSVFFSSVGFLASFAIGVKPKLSEILLIISDIGELFCISLLYLIPAILMIIPGIMVFVRKEKSTSKAI